MSASTPSSESARHRLIDCRLDLLDRLLVGAVSRNERLETVNRTQIQIQNLLAAIPTDQPTDEQVLQVLAQMDSPEMVLAAAQSRDSSAGGGWQPGVSPVATNWGPPSARPVSKKARWACGLGALSLLALLGAPFVYFGISMMGMVASELLIYGVLGTYLVVLTLLSLLAIVTSLVALWQLRRQRGAETGYTWATAGLGMAVWPMTVSGLAIALLCSAFLFQGTDAESQAEEQARELAYDSNGTTVEPIQDGNPIGDGFDDNLSQSPTVENSRLVSFDDESNVVTPASHAVIDETSLSDADLELPPEPAPAVISSTGTGRNQRADNRSGNSTLGGILPLVIQPTVAEPGAMFADSFDDDAIVDQFIDVETASPGE